MARRKKINLPKGVTVYKTARDWDWKYQVFRKPYSTQLKKIDANYETACSIAISRYNEVRALQQAESANASEKPIFLDEIFLQYKATESKRLAEKTISMYVQAFRKIRRKNVRISAEVITNDVEHYAKHSNDSPETKFIEISKFITFVRWCRKKKILSEEVNLSHFKPVLAKKRVAYWSDEEALAILATIQADNNQDLYNLILFMCETGTRITETLQLTWDDVKPDYISLKSKNGKRYDEIVITESISELLSEMRRLRSVAPARTIFRYKKPSWPRRLLYGYVKAANIENRNGRAFQAFRKGFSQRLFENMARLNLSIVDIKELMRHARIETTFNHYKAFNKVDMKNKLTAVNKNFNKK